MSFVDKITKMNFLSGNQKGILFCLSDGFSHVQMAKVLDIKLNTVRNNILILKQEGLIQ